MARVNTEDCWWSDPRRAALIRLVGGSHSLADGIALNAWRLAQEFWKRERQPVPREMFLALEHAELLVRSGLAVDRGEQGYYVRGSSAYLDWCFERSQAASKGGKRSAELRREFRLAQEAEIQVKQTPSKSKQTQASECQTQPSGSGSVSGSNANSKNPASQDVGNELALLPTEQLPIPKKSKFTEGTRAKMQAFMATYASAYREKYGGAPEGLRDKNIVGKIGHWIESVSQDRACQLAQVYLQIEYRPITESQHDPWLFFRHLNRIGNALSSGQDASQINWAKVFGGAA